MAGPILRVETHSDEITASLSKKTRKLRDVLDTKMQEVVDQVVDKLLTGLPGKYLDPSTIHHGVTGVGSMTIVGFIESDDKGGVYAIFPVKARVLRFIAKSGDLVFTKQVLNHPYLKSSKFTERKLTELKPWIEDQLYDAIIEAL